ncbi:Type-4 uracil-DNA glycosylase [bioreactor metagenome]|uniref:Type-4 uracil-DNA glycosylase n=1 Tax=bioreactor metagenome TaxID=1076179 RepID=A0A645C391_9ZZZZ|nr:uracil-DNA glycosylase [Oscillospiraceae bacterium]
METLSAAEKQIKLDSLKEACGKCKRCPLGETRINLVFGKGSPESKLMFIGEAPGEKEDLSGIPFVGAAGKLLDKYLAFIGLEADDVYIANILKCRPPHNRDPLPAEEDECIGYLREQVAIIRPKLIVCLGRIAAMRIIKPDFKITSEHGKWFKKGDCLITAVYHPAALLRDPRKKGEMLDDFKDIEKILKEENHSDSI